MATKKDAATTALTVPADLLAGMSAEEIAELQALTGQNANAVGAKTPVLKVNYCDVPDVNGREIKKGNFVYDQSSKTVEVEVTDEDGDTETQERMEDLGIDLGKSVTVTVLAYRQQYSYYNQTDTKQNCNSQVFGVGEVPVGSNLKLECRGGKCPRRKEGIDRNEKCACQFVIFGLVDIDGEKKPFMMYVKGSSYMPFNDYLKSAGLVPLFFAPTKMKTKMEKQGSVTYFTTSFDLDVANAYPQLERNEYKEQMKGAVAQLDEFKKQQSQKAAQKQIAAPDEGRDAVIINEEGDDNIVF